MMRTVLVPVLMLASSPAVGCFWAHDRGGYVEPRHEEHREEHREDRGDHHDEHREDRHDDHHDEHKH